MSKPPFTTAPRSTERGRAARTSDVSTMPLPTKRSSHRCFAGRPAAPSAGGRGSPSSSASVTPRRRRGEKRPRKEPIGPLAVQQQPPHTQPTTTKKSPAPLFHAATKRVREEL